MKKSMRKGSVLALSGLVLCLCFSIACQDKAAMAELEKYKAQAKVEEQNKGNVRKGAEEKNKKNAEYFMDVYSPDYAYFYPSGTSKSMSREEIIAEMKMIWEAFPDCIWNIEELVAVGDLVVSRTIVRGTHKGTFMDIPPTGNKFELNLINMSRLKNGKIVEEREDYDSLGLMQQLGMELRPKEPKK
jgi:steroid delta-isomerase-like uncharacterized protein